MNFVFHNLLSPCYSMRSLNRTTDGATANPPRRSQRQRGISIAPLPAEKPAADERREREGKNVHQAKQSRYKKVAETAPAASDVDDSDEDPSSEGANENVDPNVGAGQRQSQSPGPPTASAVLPLPKKPTPAATNDSQKDPKRSKEAEITRRKELEYQCKLLDLEQKKLEFEQKKQEHQMKLREAEHKVTMKRFEMKASRFEEKKKLKLQHRSLEKKSALKVKEIGKVGQAKQESKHATHTSSKDFLNSQISLYFVSVSLHYL